MTFDPLAFHATKRLIHKETIDGPQGFPFLLLPPPLSPASLNGHTMRAPQFTHTYPLWVHGPVLSLVD